MRKTNNVGYRKLALCVAIVIFSVVNIFAYTGSGGSITSNVGIDQISLKSISSVNTYGFGGNGLAANYTSGSLSGYFGVNFSVGSLFTDVTPPIVTLNSPTGNAARLSSNILFNFSVTDTSSINNCTLYVDAVESGSLIAPTQGENLITYSVSVGGHIWNVSCIDAYNNIAMSTAGTFRYLLVSNYDNESTDLTTVNISNILNFTLAKSDTGKIVFQGITDLSNASDLNTNIVISGFSIYVNSAVLPELNKPATLTVKNLPYNNVVVLRNNILCPDCTAFSYSGGQLVFDVTGFSNYTVTSTSRLSTFDDSDNFIVNVTQPVGFYANYSNTTSGVPINAQCYFSYYDNGWTAPTLMTYNGLSLLHEYSLVFNSSGNKNYNISCQAIDLGYDDLSVIDYASITGPLAGSFAAFNITRGESSRYDDSGTPTNTPSMSGNTTPISVYVVTNSKSWQGYYGNITDRIALLNSQETVFYNWGNVSVQGEILATRNSTVDWNTIACAGPSSISKEDTFLQKDINDSDSMNNTFNMTNHPIFMISSTILTGCKSTKVFGPDGQNNGFWNIAIADNNGAGSMIYTGIIDPGKYGFHNSTINFELLVAAPSNLDNSLYHTYYFYLELG